MLLCPAAVKEAVGPTTIRSSLIGRQSRSRAEWGNEVHISYEYVKTNTTDRDSCNCGPIAPMAPITGRPDKAIFSTLSMLIA